MGFFDDDGSLPDETLNGKGIGCASVNGCRLVLVGRAGLGVKNSQNCCYYTYNVTPDIRKKLHLQVISQETYHGLRLRPIAPTNFGANL